MPLTQKHAAPPQPAMDSRVHPLGGVDAASLVLSFAVLMLLSYLHSRGHIFWGDEIMGWEVTRQPSFAQLWQVWSAGNDSSGIWFYVFARPWMALFGASELTFRLFSAFGVALSFAVTWLCARRFYRLGVVATVLPLIYLLNRVVVWQLANGRTYGVLLTATALCGYALVRTDPRDPEAQGGRALLLTLGGMLLLTGSHILGPLYWGIFFAGFVVRDLLFRVFRPRVLLAALLGVAVFPVGWGNLRATMALGKPTYWTLKPHLLDIFSGLDLFARATGLMMLAALVLFLLVRSRRGPAPWLLSARTSLYCAMAVPVALVLTMFVLSRVSTSVFVDRYLMPVLLFNCLFLCELADRTWGALALPPPARAAVGALAALAVAAVCAYNFRHHMAIPGRDYTPELLARVPAGEPVIVTDVSHFMDLVFYRRAERELVIPVDWSVQLDPDFGGGGASPEHELDNWRDAGIFAGNIQTTQQTLAGKPHFAVIAEQDHTLWVRRYLLNNPRYTVRELAPWHDLRLWQVDAR